jgi:hypothetical protein
LIMHRFCCGSNSPSCSHTIPLLYSYMGRKVNMRELGSLNPKRSNVNRTIVLIAVVTGWLSDGFERLNGTHRVLWNAADIRRTGGRHMRMYTGGEGFRYVGYHFHNYFPSIEVLRKKYKTYWHLVNDALDIQLGNIMKMQRRCCIAVLVSRRRVLIQHILWRRTT